MFCVAEVVHTVFDKMAKENGAVIVDASRNEYVKCVKSETTLRTVKERAVLVGYVS
jgi:hypothetical protein